MTTTHKASEASTLGNVSNERATYKLTPEQVLVYEEMSAFKTTGDVEITMSSQKEWQRYVEALSSLYDLGGSE